jgi:hypothetical protein
MLYSPDGKVSITRKVATGINYDRIVCRLDGGGHR